MGHSLYPLLRDILLAHRCQFLRQGKGSHEIWHNPANDRRFPVPVTVVNRHTVNELLKQAGIKEKI